MGYTGIEYRKVYGKKRNSLGNATRQVWKKIDNIPILGGILNSTGFGAIVKGGTSLISGDVKGVANAGLDYLANKVPGSGLATELVKGAINQGEQELTDAEQAQLDAENKQESIDRFNEKSRIQDEEIQAQRDRIATDKEFRKMVRQQTLGKGSGTSNAFTQRFMGR